MEITDVVQKYGNLIGFGKLRVFYLCVKPAHVFMYKYTVLCVKLYLNILLFMMFLWLNFQLNDSLSEWETLQLSLQEPWLVIDRFPFYIW